MRTRLLKSYVEILGLANAAYVAQHLHNHLHNGLGLDVLLPTGICSAIRMALFISVMRDRPEAFSLFSAAPSHWSCHSQQERTRMRRTTSCGCK